MNIIKYELIELEERVEQGFTSAAKALKEIKDSKIYKDQYGTWENYLKERWGYSDQWYLNLISASRVIDNLKTQQFVGVLPSNEGQTRELADIKEPDQQIKVWKAVTEKFEPNEITASKIKEVKEEILEPDIEVIENNIKEIDYSSRFEIMQDTGDKIIEMMQILYKEAVKLKAGTKYIEWLGNFIIHNINTYENEN